MQVRRRLTYFGPIIRAGARRSALARAELEEALEVIARLAPNTELIGPPDRFSGATGVREVDRMETIFV